MPTKLKVYTNEDDALIFWSIAQPIQECRGFAIKRRIKRKGKKETQEDFLPNRTGFQNEKVDAKPRAGQEEVTRPSLEWPIQRFSWTDHDAGTGDTVSYQVIPVIRNGAGILELLESEASPWSPKKKLDTPRGKFKPYFNRGFVISQFMSRYLAENKLSLQDFKDRIGEKDDKTIRQFLSGGVRLALLKELEIARKQGGQIFAALFELSDDELVEALCKLKGRANVVLSNGSIQPDKGESSNGCPQAG